MTVTREFLFDLWTGEIGEGVCVIAVATVWSRTFEERCRIVEVAFCFIDGFDFFGGHDWFHGSVDVGCVCRWEIVRALLVAAAIAMRNSRATRDRHWLIGTWGDATIRTITAATASC